jgi:hypothetical protein
MVHRFEEAIYGTAFLLLAVAAVLVVIGTFGAVIQAVTRQVSTLEGGVLVLERTLLTLIIAELAYTLRTDFLHHEIAAEPFLFIAQIDPTLYRPVLAAPVVECVSRAAAAKLARCRDSDYQRLPRPRR